MGMVIHRGDPDAVPRFGGVADRHWSRMGVENDDGEKRHPQICGEANFGLGNSFSQRAITTVARQLPRTFTAVRPMSISWSMPKRRKRGSVGRWKEAAVASTITRAARATPAVPLLLMRRVRSMTACCAIVR